MNLSFTYAKRFVDQSSDSDEVLKATLLITDLYHREKLSRDELRQLMTIISNKNLQLRSAKMKAEQHIVIIPTPVLKALAERLDLVVENGPQNDYLEKYGLCHLIYNWFLVHGSSTTYTRFDRFRIEVSKKWEFYSGSSTHPIPGQYDHESSLDKVSPLDFYTLYFDAGMLWDYETAYGTLRRKYTAFISSQVKKVIEGRENGNTK